MIPDTPFFSQLMADNPKSVALQAIDALFIHRDLDLYETFVADDAVHKNREPGSAIWKIHRYKRSQQPRHVLSQVWFFDANELDRLESLYPHKLWSRVRGHIGQQQGVLIKLALTGKDRDRAISLGEDPNEVGMMTWVLSDDCPSKIVHVDFS